MAIQTKKTPTEIIGDMVRERMNATKELVEA
jgi:hypothetical protein